MGAPLPSGHAHRLAAPQPGAGGRIRSPVRRAPRALPARPGPARHGGAQADGRAGRRVLAAPAHPAPALAPGAGAAARPAAGSGDAALGGGWERVLVGPDDGAECARSVRRRGAAAAGSAGARAHPLGAAGGRVRGAARGPRSGEVRARSHAGVGVDLEAVGSGAGQSVRGAGAGRGRAGAGDRGPAGEARAVGVRLPKLDLAGVGKPRGDVRGRGRPGGGGGSNG